MLKAFTMNSTFNSMPWFHEETRFGKVIAEPFGETMDHRSEHIKVLMNKKVFLQLSCFLINIII